MKVKGVSKLQQGGAAPAPVEGAPAQTSQGGGDPLQQILAMAQQAVQGNDGQLALQVCATLLQVASGSQGGGEPQGQTPMQRKGGQIKIKRA